MVSRFGKEMNRSMTEEQFCQVVEAILNGKYSWACVLILRFAGYNPLHYIPYRTYNRLMKEHSGKKSRHRNYSNGYHSDSLEVDNLPHLTPLQSHSCKVEGGRHFREYYDFLEICLNQN